MNKLVLFDLDDTIIDTRFRQYTVISTFLQHMNICYKFLSLDDYCNLRKKEKLSNIKLLQYWTTKDEHLNQFKYFWKENIESFKFLRLDSLLISIDTLKAFKRDTQCSLGILSLRSNPANAHKQIALLGLDKVFNVIKFENHSKMINPKIATLKRLTFNYDISAFVGDAFTDMEAAEKCDVKFYPVNTGIYKFFQKEYTITEVLKKLEYEN